MSRLFAVRLHCSLATCWCPRWSWAEVVAAQPCQSGECRVPHRETSLDFHPTLLCGRRRPCAALCCGRRPSCPSRRPAPGGLAALSPCGGLSSWLGFWLPAWPLDPGTRTRGARVAPAGAAGGRRQAGRAHSRSCRSCREDPEPSPMLPRHLPLLARAPTPPRAHGDSGGAFCLFAAPSLRSCGFKGDSGRLFPAARVLGR